MDPVMHLSIPLFMFCGFLGALSSPVTETTTLSPTTTISLNDSNSSLLGEEGPIILAEGDVDVLILNLGGILSEEELNNGTEGNNASVSKPSTFIRRDIAAVASTEKSLIQVNQISTTTEITSSIKPNRKRSIGQDLLSFFQLNKAPSVQDDCPSCTDETTTSSSTDESVVSTKAVKRSIIDDITVEKSTTQKLDKESHKTDPTVSKLVKRSNVLPQLGALFSTEPTTKSSA